MAERRKYKYFGNGEISTPQVHFKKFGQEIALSDAEALDIAQAGGILTSEIFDEIGYTPLEKSNRHERNCATNAEFNARHQKALSKRQELIDELKQRIAAPPPLVAGNTLPEDEQ